MDNVLGGVGEDARIAGLKAAFQVMCDEEALDAGSDILAGAADKSEDI